MPRTLLYLGFGIQGYDYLKSEYKAGQVYFHLQGSRKRCAHCCSLWVIQKGVKVRVIRTVPIGRKAVFLVIRMRRFWCEECGRTRYERLRIADSNRHYTHVLETYATSVPPGLGSDRTNCLFISYIGQKRSYLLRLNPAFLAQKSIA